MKKIIFVLALVCGLAVFGFLGHNCLQAKDANPGSVQQFTLSDIQGKKVSLSSFKNRPVLLFFWTTWCPYCRQELKGLEEQQGQLKRDGIEVLLIDVGEESGYIKGFVKKNNITYTVLLDTTTRVAASFGVRGIPTFVLINKSGARVYIANNFPARYKELISK